MRTIQALWIRNLKNFIRDRVRLIFSILIPFFFIYVFSSIFKNDAVKNPTAFLMAGVIIATVFQTSLSVATSTIDDIVSGFMKEVLVSPVKRIYIALGQLLSAATIATMQGVLILVIGLFVGLKFTSWTTPVYVVLCMIGVGIVFSSFGLFLATIVKNAQTFQIVQQAIVLPFTFISGAYLPLTLLPKALQIVAYFNPMTYTTALFRTIILEQGGLSNAAKVKLGLAFDINGFIVTPWMSGIVVLIFGLFFLFLATLSFTKADLSQITRTPGGSNRRL
ncbi:ABC transporter permease [Enterococcus rivorum]|uniref:Transport permease protein n=1 Tax=Enterococcus rivorum TaxID=762845 RepID=A0A1E5KXL0_9ENTE|nr:ABC transporter permease [Enterococcus rivorum]MBP2099470.1 ABC-2 type transport system permease protein [Enterococcus rivorum]OEH82584.1 transporter [Enterococcus rivorum]